MVIIDAIVILAILSFLGTLLGTLLKNRARRIERRENQEFQLKQLTAAKEVIAVMMLDEENAVRIYQQLERELRSKNKLPPTDTPPQLPAKS